MDSTRLFNSLRDEEQFEGYQQFENIHLWDHTNQLVVLNHTLLLLL